LAQILFAKNAKVYVAARSQGKAEEAIAYIKTNVPDSKGALVFLRLDLGDLTTIKASAQEFLNKESRLDVLFNNAGVMTPPQGSKTAQGYELQLGTNNIGTFLFTKLLTPILVETAKSSLPGSVRVIWVSSSGAELLGPKPGGLVMTNLDYHIEQSSQYKYGVSKAGNILHAREFARRHGRDGVISVALNPGNLKTDLARHNGPIVRFLISPMQFPPILGAYTELFAGLSPDITADRVNGQDWGKFKCPIVFS
jgi:retinol dehydrogenase 12